MLSYKHRLIFPFFLPFITILVYIIFAGRLEFTFPVTIYNYFSYLSEAFLHGSLAFISSPPFLHDLTTVNGKIYMYWGPSPVLLIALFVAIFGLKVSDALYTAIIGSFSPLLLYILLNQLEKIRLFQEKVRLFQITNFQKTILCLFFVFGTVHFYLSVFGTVWFTSQIVSIFYLLLGLVLIVMYSKSRNKFSLIFSSLFFALAVNTRSTLIFYLPLFLCFLTFAHLGNKYSIRKIIASVSIFLLIGIFILILNLLYNFFRFGSIFESGYTYQHYAAHFAQDKQMYGYFNSAYIPKNFYYMFLNLPSVSKDFPYFTFDEEGNSVLFTSPFLLLALLIFKRKYWLNNRMKFINLSCLFGASAIIFILLNFWGTGWVQFGYRYFLDVIPFLIILLVQVIANVPKPITLTLLFASILINLLGTIWFLNL